MALGAHMCPYSYMYCAPHRDGVLQFSFPFWAYSAHDMVMVDCSSMRSLDDSSTLDYTDCYVGYYTYYIPKCIVLAPLNSAQRGSHPNIQNSDEDYFPTRI